MAYGVYSDRGYREHILERNKNTNKTEVFAQEDQSFTGRKTFLSGVTTSDLEVQTVEVSESLKVKGKDITRIIDYLPNDVSKENKLTTEYFVNSSISTNTANFLGTFNTLEEIEALTDVTNNDYAFWKTTDTFGSVVFRRYKYIANEQLWKFEYDLNNSSFTATQWEAINSGITAELVAKIDDGSAIVPSITEAEYEKIPNKKDGQIREITDAPDKPVPFATLNDTLMTATNVLSALKIKAMIDDVKTEIDARHKYSTEEKVIGEWIDGKPIYRKVLNINAVNLLNWEYIPETDNLSIKKIINATAMGTNESFTDCVANLYARRYPNGNFGFIALNWSIIATVIILEYTKTTD